MNESIRRREDPLEISYHFNKEERRGVVVLAEESAGLSEHAAMLYPPSSLLKH